MSALVCKHQHLARQCLTCELEADLSASRAEAAQLREALDGAVRLLVTKYGDRIECDEGHYGCTRVDAALQAAKAALSSPAGKDALEAVRMVATSLRELSSTGVVECLKNEHGDSPWPDCDCYSCLIVTKGREALAAIAKAFPGVAR